MRRLRSFTLDGQIESGGAWVGTPDEIKAIIRRVVAAVGTFEHASLQINFGNIDVREAQKSMRLFASQVMPEFAGATDRPPARQPEPLAQANRAAPGGPASRTTQAALSDGGGEPHGPGCRCQGR